MYLTRLYWNNVSSNTHCLLCRLFLASGRKRRKQDGKQKQRTTWKEQASEDEDQRKIIHEQIMYGVNSVRVEHGDRTLSMFYASRCICIVLQSTMKHINQRDPVAVSVLFCNTITKRDPVAVSVLYCNQPWNTLTNETQSLYLYCSATQ